MDILIQYQNGQMNIHLHGFFPTSQARLKKLLKVVDLDYEHRDELIETMLKFCQGKVKELEEKRISSGKKALEYKQKIVDTDVIIKSKKHPNGIRVTKEELDEFKEKNKVFKKEYTHNLKEFNKCIKNKETFLKHIKILEQRK